MFEQESFYKYIGLIAIILIGLYVGQKVIKYQTKVVEALTSSSGDPSGVTSTVTSNTDKIKPNELLPKGSIDMKGENFLATSLARSEQIIGQATQNQRSRKNYDLRSTPPNPQDEVSPWNISTIEPDTSRRQFEIGTTSC